MKNATLEEKQEFYGKDAKDWLGRWKAGKTVWSISMGGLGPNYELALQGAVAETLEHLLENHDVEKFNWKETPDEVWAKIESGIDGIKYSDKGLSGAMVGAARSLALQLWKKGPIGIMDDDEVRDRHIQVEKIG